MYRIPENINLEILKGESISQISYGLNCITLTFSKGYISIEGSFSVSFENHYQLIEEVCPAKDDYRLLQILEESIIDIEIDEERTILKLTFQNGFTLELVGNEMYESYSISIGETKFIV